MPYSQPQDILKKFNPSMTTNLSPDEVARKIDFADAIINSALARRYTIPFAQAPGSPPVINFISATLAMGELLDRTPGNTDWVVRDVEYARSLLTMLANGDMAIVGVDGTLLGELETTGMILSSTSIYNPTFGASPSNREEVDPNRVLDEDTARTKVGIR